MSNLENLIQMATQNDVAQAAQQATGAAFRADPMLALGVVVVVVVTLCAAFTLHTHWSR